ncbi:MAG: heme ABC transporter ATP-binding protein [Armatimonadota bacterium]
MPRSLPRLGPDHRMVLLEVNGITVQFGASRVLDGVTFSVRKGEFVGIVGPNGSGKTTLIRTISRVLSPRVGTVMLGGEDVRRLTQTLLARRVAVVPQSAQVGFDFTVEELVLMGRAPHQGRLGLDTEKDREIARHAMARTRVLHLAERSAQSLSGGELQRVMLARALAQQPEVLLLDEPTSHLDMSFQVEVLEMVRALSRHDGITVIAVLHDLNLASCYCERLVLLKEGAVVAIGRPEDVLTADLIADVYGADVLVRPHPVTGRPHVMIVPGPVPTAPRSDRGRVHVVCGGGSGIAVLRALVRAGFHVTAGVLNVGDSDHSAALALDIRVAEEPPFCAVTEARAAQNRELAEQADCVLLCDTPFGPGNLANLEVVVDLRKRGMPVVILERKPVSVRDFTDGRASDLYQCLLDTGVAVVNTTDDAVREIGRVCAQVRQSVWDE